ncbi:PspC domain-containing protein [Marisediminicola antarctica]|uniref:Phage shock protein PspC N-terminal domain-containing protein n=1 Tax=Marisediminicola antarctica TaxID=674079 RepID=A0A7L5AEJ2_9MICO|nr:PspC domain-containing protein [Marisediminicola antarctica]QHO68798.1 hypothetical protein BHD05_03235 [Marisediminicola antarctica]
MPTETNPENPSDQPETRPGTQSESPSGTQPEPQPQPETPPAAPSGATPPRSNRFFSWMRSLDIPRQPGWIGGVCAGIASRIGIDPIIVRGIVVVLAVLGAPLLLAYAAAWMMLPDRTGRIHAEELGRGDFEPAVAGAGLLVLLSLLPGFWFGDIGWGLPYIGGGDFGGFARAVWTLAIIAAAIWFVIWIVRRSGRGSAQQADAASPAYGQPAYGQPAYGQPAYGQPAYGQPAYSMPGSSAASSPGAFPTSAPTTASSYAPNNAPGTAATSPMATAPAGPPPTDATELAAWTAQQTRFKQERDEFVKSEEEAKRAAFAAHAEEQRRIREERAAAYREERQLTRSNPFYTLVAIGLALVVGALVTLVVGEFAFTTQGLVAGLASALAVLGAAIVINGIRGKRSGGSSGLAVVVAIALVGAGAVNGFNSVDFVAGGARFMAIAGDDTEFAPSHADGRSQDFVVGVGDAVIDLTGYWDGQTGSLPRPASVDIVGGLGDITVILPRNEFATVDPIVGWGALSTPDGDFAPGSYDLTLEFGPEGETAGATDRWLNIDVIVGAGDLTITTEGDR